MIVFDGPKKTANEAPVAGRRASVRDECLEAETQRIQARTISGEQSLADEPVDLLAQESRLRARPQRDAPFKLGEQVKVAELQNPAVSLCDRAAARKLISDDGANVGFSGFRNSPNDLQPSSLAFNTFDQHGVAERCTILVERP